MRPYRRCVLAPIPSQDGVAPAARAGGVGMTGESEKQRTRWATDPSVRSGEPDPSSRDRGDAPDQLGERAASAYEFTFWPISSTSGRRRDQAGNFPGVSA